MEHNITLTIDGKMHKLVNDRLVPCTNCSLIDFCRSKKGLCPADILGGDYFVELKVEK